MKRLGILAGFVVILLVGGVITSGILPEFPVIIQSLNPDASVFEATPEQANLFFIWVGFVIVNLVGAGLTLAALFWAGSYFVKLVNQEDESDNA